MKSGSWYSNYCGRPVKDKEMHMCGIHAKFYHRRERSYKDTMENMELSRYIMNETKALAQKINDEYDLDVDPVLGSRAGLVSVDPKRLLALLGMYEEPV